MPHVRKRYALEIISDLCRFSPIVGVLGHRQVGKTTCLEQICDEYATFDLPTELESAMVDPVGYIERRRKRLTGLDECQMAPSLFGVLKERVRVDKRPGQFLLSGSVRFTARKEIHESLTGRIMNVELLPFVVSELSHDPLPSHLPRLMETSTEVIAQGLRASDPHGDRREIRRYLAQGGLPGICFVRQSSLKKQKIDAQLRTILGRDFQTLQKSSLPYLKLRELVRLLSLRQGEPLNVTELSRQARISVPTLSKTLATLENLFLIRFYPVRGGEKRPVFFFEDQGEVSVLAGFREDDGGSEVPLSDLLRFFYANARAQFMYRAEEATEVFQHRTRGGACVPLAFERKGRRLGVVPMLSENPDASDLRSAASFLKAYTGSKIVFIHAGSKIQALDSRQLVAPAMALLR